MKLDSWKIRVLLLELLLNGVSTHPLYIIQGHWQRLLLSFQVMFQRICSWVGLHYSIYRAEFHYVSSLLGEWILSCLFQLSAGISSTINLVWHVWVSGASIYIFLTPCYQILFMYYHYYFALVYRGTYLSRSLAGAQLQRSIFQFCFELGKLISYLFMYRFGSGFVIFIVTYRPCHALFFIIKRQLLLLGKKY